jgi:type IV pilus assembly protein PilM
VVEKNIVEVEAVGEAIRRAVARSGTKAKHAAAAVAGSAVITKVIPMPADLDEADWKHRSSSRRAITSRIRSRK